MIASSEVPAWRGVNVVVVCACVVTVDSLAIWARPHCRINVASAAGPLSALFSGLWSAGEAVGPAVGMKIGVSTLTALRDGQLHSYSLRVFVFKITNKRGGELSAGVN